MEVTRRFNRYFINNNNKKKKKKKKKIDIITIININIDNNSNNNSHEDLDQLLIIEPQYRFCNSMHVVISKIITFCVITLCVRKVITICVERLLHFALKILLHFALVLHFAAILITFCVNITFCGDYYILRRSNNFHKSGTFVFVCITASTFISLLKSLQMLHHFNVKHL